MSTKQNIPDSSQKGGEPRMVQRSLQVEYDVWEQAKRKASRSAMPVSSVVRHLLRAWVDGKVQITINGDDN
jgi:macrodomain Ter protein organizer (MatP/YcbG family)